MGRIGYFTKILTCTKFTKDVAKSDPTSHAMVQPYTNVLVEWKKCVYGSSLQMLCLKKIQSHYYEKRLVSTFKRVGLFHNNAHRFKLAQNSESHTTIFYHQVLATLFTLFRTFYKSQLPSKRSLRKSTNCDSVHKLIQSFPPLHCWIIADTV